ncbi:hypothetical protein GCM10027174_37910 [Salinifilum aidingensis]
MCSVGAGEDGGEVRAERTPREDHYATGATDMGLSLLPPPVVCDGWHAISVYRFVTPPESGDVKRPPSALETTARGNPVVRTGADPRGRRHPSPTAGRSPVPRPRTPEFRATARIAPVLLPANVAPVNRVPSGRTDASHTTR